MDGKWVGNGQGSSTPSLILRMGGRIVCASRHPPRPLEAWSLEAWSLEAWKRLARGLEEAWSTSWEWSWELKFHEKCLPGWVLAAQATKVACKECQEGGKEGQGGPKDDQINTPNGPKTYPRRLIWESWRRFLGVFRRKISSELEIADLAKT